MIALSTLVLGLVLSVDKVRTPVALGEPIALTVHLKNDGAEPYSGPALTLDARSVTLMVEHDPIPGASRHSWAYTQTRDEAPAKRTLAPGETWTETISFMPTRARRYHLDVKYPGAAELCASEVDVFPKDGAKELGWRMETSKGVLTARFLRDAEPNDAAPNHIAHFAALVAQGFYDGTAFHRVLKGFMAQGGDPTSARDPANAGEGGPGYTIPAEFSKDPKFSHTRGRISTARDDSPDSGGSQFFICFDGALRLDGKYTAFAELADAASLETLAKIEAVGAQKDPEKPSEYVKITKATLVPMKVNDAEKSK